MGNQSEYPSPSDYGLTNRSDARKRQAETADGAVIRPPISRVDLSDAGFGCDPHRASDHRHVIGYPSAAIGEDSSNSTPDECRRGCNCFPPIPSDITGSAARIDTTFGRGASTFEVDAISER